MNSFVVALILTTGAGVWIYTKLQKYSGNNTKQSATAAGAASLVIFAILLFVANKLVK